MNKIAEFAVIGMAFSFIVLVSFLFGYNHGKTSLMRESNAKILQALKLERD